jgi:hypothetical protein
MFHEYKVYIPETQPSGRWTMPFLIFGGNFLRFCLDELQKTIYIRARQCDIFMYFYTV